MVTDHLPVLISYLDREQRFRFVNKTYHDWFGIVAAMGEPFALDGQPVAVTTSIGVAFYEGGAATAAELVREADQRLYEAKDAGRNTYRASPPPASKNDPLSAPRAESA